jgi:isopentenyl phosphate kinase
MRCLPSRFSWVIGTLLVLAQIACIRQVSAIQENEEEDMRVILVKIGGSSITYKAEKENLDQESLSWFVRSISNAVGERFRGPDEGECESTPRHPIAFVVIHGAGSFGHFTAKEFGLKGQIQAPPSNSTLLSVEQNRYRKRGLAETRLSVQKLNHLVVATFLDHGINAVGISPCFGIPGLEAHANQQIDPAASLETVVRRTIQAGLVPVLHGDACLYGDDAGILSGDTIMEVLGTKPWVTKAIFITDVDGVFDNDPRENPHAQLLRDISVDPETGDITTEISASGSSHEHDVTGGLKVRCIEREDVKVVTVALIIC